MMEIHLLIITIRKNNTFCSIKKNKNIKEIYTDRSKNIRRKVSFAEVFTDITRRGALFEETSIHTDEMTAMKVLLKEVHKKEDKRWVIQYIQILKALCSPLNSIKKITHN